MAHSIREFRTTQVGPFLASPLGPVPPAAAEDGDRHPGARMAANAIAHTGAFVVTADDTEAVIEAIGRTLLGESPAPLSGVSDWRWVH